MNERSDGMLDDIKDFLEDYWILVLMGVGLIGFVIWFFIPRDYTLDVKRIQWEYIVHIEEFMVQHHDDDRSKPSDAYNVKSHYHPRTKTWTDDDVWIGEKRCKDLSMRQDPILVLQSPNGYLWRMKFRLFRLSEQNGQSFEIIDGSWTTLTL